MSESLTVVALDSFYITLHSYYQYDSIDW